MGDKTETGEAAAEGQLGGGAPATSAPPAAKGPKPMPKVGATVQLRLSINGGRMSLIKGRVVKHAPSRQLVVAWTHPMSRGEIEGVYAPAAGEDGQGWIGD